MARLVATLPPPRTRQASVVAYPRGTGPRPKALPSKAVSNLGLWRWYKVPEVYSVANWTAAGVSRVSFVPCLDRPGRKGDACPPLIDDDDEIAEGVDARLARDAQALWSLVRSPMGGQSALWNALTVCLEVAGDGWLFSYPANDDLGYDPDGQLVWMSLARHALDTRSNFYEVDVGTEAKVKVPTEEGRAVRVFRSHPTKPAQADSWVTAVERHLEILSAIYEALAACALSRMHAGVILAPTDQDKATPGAMTTEQAEKVLGGPLYEELSAQLADHVEQSAAELDGFARAVPVVVGLRAELTDRVKWLELARDIDPELGKRVDDLRYEIAMGAPTQPEILLGLGETNHWNTATISQADYQRTVQPDCELICDATTPHLLRSGLVAMGHTPQAAATVRVGYDPSALVDPPDRSEAAVAVSSRPIPLLTDAETRDAMGLGEYAGPDDDERRLAMAFELAKERAEYGAVLLPLLGLPAPTVAPADPTVQQASAIESTSTPATAALPVRSAAPPSADDNTGRALALIGARFEDRLAVLLAAIVDRMVERAGLRVASLAKTQASWAEVRDLVRDAPVGLRGAVPGVNTRLAAAEVDDEDLLGGALAAFADRFEAEVRKAQRRAVETAGGDWGILEPEAEQSSAAAWALAGTLLIAEARRRFDGALAPEAVGEGVGADAFAVPALLVRRVSAVAGGGVDPGASPAGGATSALLSVATGPIAQRALRQSGTEVVAWFWDYGDEPRAAFEEHLDLHGTVEAGSTPGDFDGWFPGDHNGCRCQLRPITGSGVGGEGVRFDPNDDEPEEG